MHPASHTQNSRIVIPARIGAVTGSRPASFGRKSSLIDSGPAVRSPQNPAGPLSFPPPYPRLATAPTRRRSRRLAARRPGAFAQRHTAPPPVASPERGFGHESAARLLAGRSGRSSQPTHEGGC